MCLMTKRPKHKTTEQCCNKFNKDLKNGPHLKKKNLKKNNTDDLQIQSMCQYLNRSYPNSNFSPTPVFLHPSKCKTVSFHSQLLCIQEEKIKFMISLGET